MHDTRLMHDSVMEEVIPSLSPTARLESSSCENSQIVENNISPIVAPVGLVVQEFDIRSIWISFD